MKRIVKVENKKIIYTIKKSNRAKKIRIVVDYEGVVSVTVPRGIPEWLAIRFVKSKKKWLLEKVIVANNIPKLTKKDYLDNKGKALILINSKIKHFNQFYNFQYNNIFVKNQKTRWGSCSSKKNLNFNYKIVFLSSKFQDYIIVHELCHLKELNHSPDFWNQVARVIPEYSKLRKELNKKGLNFKIK